MIKIIPAIDIINGHCVRLSQGDYQRITDYSESPAAMAENFEALGFKRLHVVDLDGARSGKVINIKALKEITSRTNLIVDFGGGIKSEEDLKNVFEAGASAVSIGSIAVSDPDIVSLWADSFGAEKFIISADVRDNIQALLLINLYQDTGIKIYAACYVLISRATECCAVQILNCTKPLWNNSPIAN